nr:hypothetical protein [Anaerolineae bacterium]
MEEYEDWDNPSFPQEEEDLEEGDVVESGGAQNRTFLIGTLILAAVFVIAIVVVLLLLLRGGRGEPEVSDVDQTNQANEALWQATQTAQFLTDTAPTPVPPTETPIPPTATNTPEFVPTEETAETPEETPIESPTEPGGEGTEEGPSPTPGLIEVTPIGGEGTGQPTAAGGTIEPTSEVDELPDTGFASLGLAGAGVLAVLLVAVIIVTRSTRMR